MIYYKEFEFFFGDIVGDRKKVDNTIYSLDIETTSYLILNGKILPTIDYLKLSKKEQEECEFRSCMYIWMFSINDKVYYGRTWGELRSFLIRLDFYNNNKKILFIHNASFEFQFLKSQFKFKKVVARKKHKIMKCEFVDFNIEIHCTYMMSNCSLKQLPKVFKLPVEKKVGDLDYSLLRTSVTKLTKKELGYCEYDCLVIYHYIKRELETYGRVDKIPITSTGKVRRELKELVNLDWDYKKKVKKAININPHIYNMLQKAFAGRIYTFVMGFHKLHIKKYKIFRFYKFISVYISNTSISVN